MNANSSIGRLLASYKTVHETLLQSPFNFTKEAVDKLTVLDLARFINLMGRMDYPAPEYAREKFMRMDAVNGCLTVNEYNGWKGLPAVEDGDRPYCPTAEEIAEYQRACPHPLWKSGFPGLTFFPWASKPMPGAKRYVVADVTGDMLFESDGRDEAFAYLNANPGLAAVVMDRTVKPRFITFAGTFSSVEEGKRIYGDRRYAMDQTEKESPIPNFESDAK